MALQNRTNNQRIFLGISFGKITHKIQGQENPETYTDVEGHLTKIIVRDAEIKGQLTPFVGFVLEDGADTYELSVQKNSGVARSIILALASVQDFVGNVVRINPYLSKDGEHTNVAVYVNGQKVSWVVEPSQIPPMKVVQVGSQQVKDDSDRIKFVDQHIRLIQQRLLVANATPQAQAQSFAEAGAPVDDDLPENGDFFGDGSGTHI